MKRRALILGSVTLSLADILPVVTFAAESTNGATNIPAEWAPRLKHLTNDTTAPTVFFSRDLTAAGLERLYDATGFVASGRTGIKVTLEAPHGPHVDPQLIAPLVKRLNGTLIDCNGFTPPRNRTASHLESARVNGFTAIAPIDILDAEGDMELPITGGTFLKAARTGAHLAHYETLIAITRFKAHHLPRYGGMLKSLSICMGSIAGKARIHSLGATDAGYRGAPDDETTQAMADAVKGVVEYRRGHALYIGVMDAIDPDDGDPQAQNLGNVGLFASTDPVALDQAMIDIAYGAAPSAQVADRWCREHMTDLTEKAAAIGAGSVNFRLSEVA